jgi:phosphonate transport system substrate-binding protein
MKRRALPALLALLLLLIAPAPPAARGANAGGNPFGPRGLRVGYSTGLISDLSKADAQAALEVYAREFARVIGYNVPYKLTLFDDLAECVAAIRSGDVDFVALSSLEYLRIRGTVEIETAVIGERGGQPGEEQLLLVRKDSGIRAPEQLRGRRLAILGGGSGEIASLWLDSLLAERGLPPARRLFGGVKAAAKAQQGILPVFFGQADACVVPKSSFQTAAELNPQVGRELAVLATSPAYPVSLFCFRTTLSPERKKEFLRVVFQLKDTATGKQILTLFRLDDYSCGDDKVLDPLVALVNRNGGSGKPAPRRAPK